LGVVPVWPTAVVRASAPVDERLNSLEIIIHTEKITNE